MSIPGARLHSPADVPAPAMGTPEHVDLEPPVTTPPALNQAPDLLLRSRFRFVPDLAGALSIVVGHGRER